MSDVVTFGDAALQFSPGGDERLSTATTARIHVDGIESGAAVAAEALGGNGVWMSKLPDSPLGRQVVGSLRARGIETEITWSDPDETRQSLVFREPGRRPREETVRYDCRNTAAATANPGDLPMGRIQGADAVFGAASTAVLSEQAATTTQAMLRAAQGSGVVTAAALDYRPGLASAARYREQVVDLVENLDVLVAADSDVESVFNTSGQTRELAHTLAAEFDIETVVITRHDGGAVALQDSTGTNVMHEQEGIETETVDATGQEAAFVGALLQQLAADADLPTALETAVAAGAFVCTVPGPLLTATAGEIEHITDEPSRESQESTRR